MQTKTLQLHKVSVDERVELQDSLAVEEPLEIWLRYYDENLQLATQRVSVTMRTPGDDEALVRGWLFSSLGIDPNDLISVRHTGKDALKGETGNRILAAIRPGFKIDQKHISRNDVSTSSCGICGQASIEHLTEILLPIEPSKRIFLSRQQILQLVLAMATQQALFRATGGCHGVGLIDNSGQLLDVYEDVGRHNAMDKLIGHYLGLFPTQSAVLLSGRVSFEMVQKSVRAGISMIIAIGAPTSLAVELCQTFDICLVGFVKPQQFNVYSCQSQVLLEDRPSETN